ncbi:hypothetical protein CSAL01_10283 [Colletotrichum salicis]|uniref:Uncharacterized protein n=1 Tax=Colletotrichum salicis TaxID=1209931 RepID=A0A135V6K1_9PEZI|nr:hypothetical protein CSAL01_10283 [Colletotrichum salicis]
MDLPSNGGQEPGKACWGVANSCGAPTNRVSIAVVALTSLCAHVLRCLTAEQSCLCESPIKGFFCVVPRRQYFLLRPAIEISNAAATPPLNGGLLATKALEQVLDWGVVTEQRETTLSESSASCLDETGWAGSLGLCCDAKVWLVE